MDIQSSSTWLGVWGVVALGWVASSCTQGSSLVAAAADCPSGQVLGATGCAVLCGGNNDCAASEVCNPAGTCEALPAGVTGIPRIATVNGNGASDGASDHAPNHIGTGLVVQGTNLEHTADDFGVIMIDGSGVVTDLTAMVIHSSPEQLELSLPETLAPDETYTLRVSNQQGSDQTSFLVLQGEPGLAGPAGATGVCTADCGNETLPGVQRISTITLIATTLLGNAAAQSGVLAQSAGAVPFNIGPVSSANGFLLGTIDRDGTGSAHVTSPEAPVDTHLLSYNALAAALDAMTGRTLIVLASTGNPASVGLGSTDGDAPAERVALFERLKAFGAPADIDGLRDDEPFVLAGYRGIGQGNGVFLMGSDAQAVYDLDPSTEPDPATADDGRRVAVVGLLVNAELVGLGTQDRRRLGATTVTSLDAGAGPISTTGALTGGDTSVAAFSATGATTLGATTVGALTVTGATTVGALTATGATTLGTTTAGALTVTGATTLGTATVGTLTVAAGNRLVVAAYDAGSNEGGEISLADSDGGNEWLIDVQGTGPSSLRMFKSGGTGSLGLSDAGVLSAADFNCVGCITGTDITDATITGADVGDGQLQGVDIADRSIASVDIAANNVTSAELADDVAANVTGFVNVPSFNPGGTFHEAAAVTGVATSGSGTTEQIHIGYFDTGCGSTARLFYRPGANTDTDGAGPGAAWNNRGWLCFCADVEDQPWCIRVSYN